MVIRGPIGCTVDFRDRLLHLEIILLKKPSRIALCNKAILNDKEPAKKIVVETKITKSLQAVTGAMWIKNTNLALDDYEAKLVNKLKENN